MSWKGKGSLASGPPLASGGTGKRLVDRFRPNDEGIGAFQREQRSAGWYRNEGSGSRYHGERKTEWDVLKENHRFIRDDEDPGEVSWEERLARAYESKLFKEFALIDLKHYKSKRLALRWRTAPEVVDGIGEETCGSLRCKHHQPRSHDSDGDGDADRYSSEGGSSDSPANGRYNRSRDERSSKRRKTKVLQLRSYELPFGYEEAGERKEALVKVRLCKRCERKLVWKPGPTLDSLPGRAPASNRRQATSDSDDKGTQRSGRHKIERKEDSHRRKSEDGKDSIGNGWNDRNRRRNDRSASPARRGPSR